MDPADFASLLEREPMRDPVMAVVDVYSKDDPYCWAILKSARHSGQLTPEMVAELIRHHCEHAKSQTAQIDKLVRMQPLAPIHIDGAAASLLTSATARIKSLEGVLVAIRARAAEGAKLRTGVPSETLASMRRVYLEEISSLVSETLDPCKPWCTRDEPGHSGACEPHEHDE